MKTKHILTALALPAMFAACTAEDIVSENSSIQQDRAKLSENFALVVGADGVESRYDANGGAPIFETGDKIGAALIDQFTYGEDVEDWKIIPSLASNTPFTYDETSEEWSVPENQPMGIGNYFFKFPYDKTDRSRAAVIYSLPTIQKQYVDEDGEVDTDAVIEAANMAIAHAVFTEDDEMGNISLKNIFTYPKFRIQFDNGQKVNTVSKVVLFNNNGSKFIVKSGFIHNNVVNYFNDVNMNDGNYDATAKATNWNAVDTYELIYNSTPTSGEAAGVATVEYSDYLIAQMPNDAEVSYDSNTENKYIDVRFVLPSVEVASDADWGMYVYTDNGMYEYNSVYKAIQFKKTTTTTVKKSVFGRNKNYNLTLAALTEAEDSEKTIVATTEDWNNLVEVYGDMKESKPLAVTVVGNLFGFDETTEMPSKRIFKIEGDATVKGDVTLSNVTVTGKTFVKEGAVLTTSETFDPAAIYNEGEVVIAKVLNTKGNVVSYNRISGVHNYGTLTVEEDAEAVFYLINYKKAEVENNGEITINGSSEGVITNNGYIALNNDFCVYEQDNTPNDGEWVNESFIYNNGEIFAKTGTLTNYGDIVNAEDAVLTCKNQQGEINNNGTLTIEDGSVTYITNNNGTIVVDKAVPANLSVRSAKGTIKYNAEGSVTFKNSLVNTINVTDDITIADLGAVKFINVVANAEITLPAAAAITTLTVEEGQTTLAKNLQVANVIVEEDAELFVPAGVTFEVTGANGSISNEGVIRVAGSLYAFNVLAGEHNGDIKDNGTSSEIKFYDEDGVALTNAWNSAVAKWSGYWYEWLKEEGNVAWYKGNPYDYVAFRATMEQWLTNDNDGGAADHLKALLGEDFPAAVDANGKLKEAPAAFTTAVNDLLETAKKAAEAVLYNVDGEFIVNMDATETLFAKVSDMKNNMAQRLNEYTVVMNVFDENAIASGYVWYDIDNVWNKLNAAQPYAYIWKSTEDLACPLYDVCEVMAQANKKDWEILFGINKTLTTSDYTTLSEVKEWLAYAAKTQDNTTLGGMAKAMADKYYTASLNWKYTDKQVQACFKVEKAEVNAKSAQF